MNTGDKIGRYVLGERIGEGAMSEVFASRHPLLARNVAIKVLKKEVCSDQQYVARFIDDARAAHGLNHPNVVRVLDVDDAAAQPFIVMDLVDGQPLDEWRAGQVDLPVAIGIARDVASALAAAHAGGLIHRDVKPSNVLIEKKTGRAKLTDFGAAKREREGGQELTQMGQRIGTPRYMAPEQVEGAKVSQCTDLFALGAVMYEMLAGRPAFEGDNVSAVFHGILLKDPPPLEQVRPEVPAPLRDLVRRLLAKKPEDRPASAEEVVAALDRLEQAPPRPPLETTTTEPAAYAAVPDPSAAADGAAPVRPRDGQPKAWGGIMSKPWLVPVAVGAGLLLVVLVGSLWLFSSPDEPRVVETEEGAPGEAPGAVAEATPEAPAGAGGGQSEPEEPAVSEPEAAPDEADAPDAGAAGPEAPSDTAAVEEDAGTSGADRPSLAQSLQQGPGEDAPEEATGGEAGTSAAAPEPPASSPEQDVAARDEPAEPESGAGAAAGGEQSPPDDAVSIVEPEPEPDTETAAEGGDQQTAALPVGEPVTGAAPALAPPNLDCPADAPGCAFLETVVAAVDPATESAPEITLNKEDGVYLDQDYLVVEVAMPEDLGGYLYLDVYTDNGEVFHLLPEPLRSDNALKAGAMIRVGVEEDERATGIRHWQISGPFSTGYLVALVTENRLFDELRPIGESIENYRPALLDALDDPDVGRTTYSVVPVDFRAR